MNLDYGVTDPFAPASQVGFGGEARTVHARRHTDSAEAWLRLLVHRKLSPTRQNYITEGTWKQALRDHVAARYLANLGQFSREIDATTFDQLIDMVCHPNHWSAWSEALDEAYPNGPKEARVFLERLQVIRNAVAHGRMASERDLERAVCYANDLADSIKSYFGRLGLEREFNVPTVVRAYDNLGNDIHVVADPNYSYRPIDFSSPPARSLSPGDTLIAEVEVDPTYAAGTYDVVWRVKTHDIGLQQGSKAILAITERHIGARLEIQFKVVSHLDWHKGSDADDVIDLYYRVRPPPA
ncbi:hypothetical protein GYM46_03130 [Brevundimonas mediterranea]|jgi:hypothetical protein|uniref:Swt1-like HEPN domain-containing protein n=1 Tax=Brevundimonas mediterranea TaxID=74329 RepID=A0AB37E487_9CAUL|nr:hypothetical protein [Brevundimonas mediterranea]QIH72048.1 hypothetical protein GYM46_03130 [Brevundimonas mediterranea]